MNSRKIHKSGRMARQAMLLLAGMGLVACGSSGNGDGEEGVAKQALAIDVLSAMITPAGTLDGGAFPVSEYDDGNFVLRGTASAADRILLASSHTANPAPVKVVQGNYDVMFQHETGSAVPQNVDSPVQTNADLSFDQSLPIVVSSVTVRPSFTLNTASFPLTEYDDGVFYLQPNSYGEQVNLGNSHSAVPDNVKVLPGFYDVVYVFESGGTLAPLNQSAVVMTALDLTTDAGLIVDVDSVDFRFNARLDSGGGFAAFPVNQYERADFSLRNTSTGDVVELGSSYELPLTVPVVAGTYDIVYQYVQGSSLPVNTDAIVASAVVISDGNPAQTADISSVLISPSFTVDGNAFPQSEYNDANFFLRSSNNSNDVMFFGASNLASPEAVRVISSTDVGNYEVLYRHEHGKDVPQNKNAVVPGQTALTLDSDANLVVPVTSVNVTGRFTLNGGSFPADAGDSVRFLLRDANNASDEFLFGLSDLGNEAVKLIPGTYDVLLDYIAGNSVPQNEMHTVKFNEVLAADKTLGVDVAAKAVDPSFTLDGAPFPVSFYESARFYLRDTTTSKRIFLGNSYGNNSAVIVVNGNYDVIYEYRFGSTVPQNSDSKVGAIVVQ